MHLAEYLALRPVPAAGVVLSLTGRCTLRCAHCSTDSTGAGTDLPAGELVRFAAGFGSRAAGRDAVGVCAPAGARASDNAPVPPVPPAVALLTGGEPLLRPRLVRELADLCRESGTATFLLTGMFYARAARVPAPVAAALDAVDHVSASLDRFHEAEVPREAVFRALRELLDRGKDVSLHLLASDGDDPYPDETAAAVRREFGDRVPMLVGRLAPVGRARTLLFAARGRTPDLPAPASDAGPCAMAAWPVVGPDGTVTACCNQDVLDLRPVPPHLLLGHVGRDDWSEIRSRTLGSPALRAIRTLGAGSCARCRELRGTEPRTDALAAVLEGPVRQLQARAGAAGFARRYGSARHADLVLLGAAADPGAAPCAG
ncbi:MULTISPECIES: radical SAM/SPASM domain-containing protein [unclassified Streptomyces]|uniref:radical SAM/SPASM domain-containing protein n=1 Tax=unclassified Streptomyces TaxID=2593676 RepID=UPI002E29D645|nr:radical SAM protein [Streptomyces sp. NBC_00223]